MPHRIVVILPAHLTTGFIWPCFPARSCSSLCRWVKVIGTSSGSFILAVSLLHFYNRQLKTNIEDIVSGYDTYNPLNLLVGQGHGKIAPQEAALLLPWWVVAIYLFIGPCGLCKPVIKSIHLSPRRSWLTCILKFAVGGGGLEEPIDSGQDEIVTMVKRCHW